MDQRERGVLALVLLAMLLAMPFGTMASAEATEGLRVDVDATPLDRPWLTDGQVLTLSAALVNPTAETVETQTDPSCGLVLSVVDASGATIADGNDACRGQERGLSLAPGEEDLRTTFTFNASDLDLDSGTYDVRIAHPATGAVSSTLVDVQRSVAWSEDLLLEGLSVMRSDVAEEGEVLLLRWRNAGPTTLAWPSDGCSLHLVNEAWSTLASCQDEAEPLAPWEVRMVTAMTLSSADVDENGRFILSTPSGERTVEHVPVGFENEAAALGLALLLEQEEAVYRNGQILQPTVRINNLGTDDLIINTTTSCRADWWATDATGHIVYDSRWDAPCIELDDQRSIDADQHIDHQGLGWGLIDRQGCTVPSGTYAIVARSDDLALSDTTTVVVEHDVPEGCAVDDGLDLEAWLDVDEEDRPSLHIEVSPTTGFSDLVLQGVCSGRMILYDDGGSVLLDQMVGCEGRHGRQYHLPSPEAVLRFDMGGVALTTSEGAVLTAGTYAMEFQLQAARPMSHAADLTIGSDTPESVEADETFVPASPPRSEEGAWIGLQATGEACWVLQTGPSSYLALANAGPEGWSPRSGLRGVYTVQEAEAAASCMGVDAAPVAVLEVQEERMPPVAVEDDVQSETTQPTVVEEDTPLLAITPTAVAAAVVSTSILGMLATAFLTNEAWRLPASSAGLWLIGFLGRTKETSDGRFQRGRIMGYLQANPGCHFRALMGALELSNGQTTHHLRVLEREEQIWRRKDGRLIRFYPMTRDLHPGIAEDQLPVPPLSMDPNSLQGRILTMLDDDGLMGDFPTQAELARRLERSQQLVSHHLRTLERYGLVEKQKMGVRSRYVLTREAIYLLERTDTERRA
jgi:predicted transcriptional regulator